MKNHELYISPYGTKKERRLRPIDFLLIVAMMIAIIIMIVL